MSDGTGRPALQAQEFDGDILCNLTFEKVEHMQGERPCQGTQS